MKIKQCTREKNEWRATTHLALVATEPILVEVALVGLAPLLLGLPAATSIVAAGAARHLLVGLCHARAAKAGLVLAKRLSAGARTCPCIRLCHSVPQLSPVPLTLG